MKVRRSHLTLFFLPMLLNACSRDIQQSDLPGSYRLEFNDGFATLELRPDGTFVQEVRQSNKNVIRTEGRWSFDSRHTRISLAPIYTVTQFNEGSGPHPASMPVERSIGGIEFVSDPDFNLAYRRIN
jgi:hypothetical protein